MGLIQNPVHFEANSGANIGIRWAPLYTAQFLTDENAQIHRFQNIFTADVATGVPIYLIAFVTFNKSLFMGLCTVTRNQFFAFEDGRMIIS